MNNIALTIRTDDTTAQEIKAFASSVGLSVSAFATVVLKQAVREGRVVLTPTLEPTPYLDKILRQADKDIKSGENMSPVFDNIDDMFDHMKKKLRDVRVQYLKDFSKQTLKLKPAQEKRLKHALQLFLSDPTHPSLYNHPLTGQWSGHSSITFGGDWRAIYKQVDDITVFVALGTHSQLYK